MTRASPPIDGPAPSSTDPADARIRVLVKLHFDFVWRSLRRQGLGAPDADDAAQQVFMIAAQKIESISPDGERSFLYGTALRVAANARRSARRHPEVADEAMDERGSPALEPDRRAELARAWTLLDELLQRLPDELARVLVLAEIEQLEVAEIAKLEGIPAGTAASRLRRARAAFDKALRRVERRNPFAMGKP